MRAAAFLDRDGVLNIDKGYLYKKEDFIWQKGAIEAIRYLNDLNYLVIIVTNQSGIARGFYTENDVKNLHNFMQEELNLNNARIDAFYYCPHHIDGKIEKYKKACSCRKPAAGMVLQAINDHDIDVKKSFLIGDKTSDIEAAQNANIKGYIFRNENLFDFVKKIVC